ncbi:transposase [Paracidovorax anthurii]|uniref:transposase n=1 Tax=Paracidovorax anthurii TaxID=78229 RepID=UPI00336AE2D1
MALGVMPDGTRDILGLWVESTEGSKFWMESLQRPENARRAGCADRRHRGA